MRRHGFTLVEMLIVVVLIGILATVALPRYREVQRKAAAAQTVGDLHVIETAAISGFGGADRWPATAPLGVVPAELAEALPGGFTFQRGAVQYQWLLTEESATTSTASYARVGADLNVAVLAVSLQAQQDLDPAFTAAGYVCPPELERARCTLANAQSTVRTLGHLCTGTASANYARACSRMCIIAPNEAYCQQNKAAVEAIIGRQLIAPPMPVAPQAPSLAGPALAPSAQPLMAPQMVPQPLAPTAPGLAPPVGPTRKVAAIAIETSDEALGASIHALWGGGGGDIVRISARRWVMYIDVRRSTTPRA